MDRGEHTISPMWLLPMLAFFATAAVTNDGFPVASRIQIGQADANGFAVIAGAAGAVAGGSKVILVTRETGHAAIADAAADGSFSTQVFAPPGVTILVKV